MPRKLQKPATAADVALEAGVDRSTVSRVLNRRFSEHRYAKETVIAIEKAAQKLGYRPSPTARALRTGKTTLIGLIVADIANTFFGQIAAATEARLRASGYRLLICNTSEDQHAQHEHLLDMIHRGIDGLIIAPTGPKGLNLVDKANIPTVFIDRPASANNPRFVGIDNHKAGALLGTHLRTQGYQRIGVIQPITYQDPTIRMRLEGLTAGLGHRASIQWAQTIDTRDAPADQQAQLRERLNLRGNRPTPALDAIVGLTNDATLLAYETLKAAGLSIGPDIGLGGIDDFRAAPLLHPALTVVAQPIEQIAQTACDLLLKQIDQNQHDIQTICEPQLIERQSLPPRTEKEPTRS